MKKFTQRITQIFDQLRSIAKYTYPFVERRDDGQKVYLREAYDVRYGVCHHRFQHMPNMHCYRIFFWREFLHLLVGLLFWAVALIIHYYIGWPYSLILPIAVIVYFILQELYIDRIRYHQRWLRGIIDLIIWVVPSVIFLIMILL